MTEEAKLVPRFRLASTVDLSKADPRCDRCGGRGILDLRRLDVPGDGPTDVPVICRCVTRRGGLLPDLLDRALAETQKRLDDGTFGDALAADLRALPEEQRVRAVGGLEQQAARVDLDPVVRREVQRALEMLRGPAAPEVQA